MLPSAVGPIPDAPSPPGIRAALAEDPVLDQPPPRSVRPKARRGDALPVVAWVASLALLACLVGAAYAWRAPIMAAWPPSERLYAALGLAHSAVGAAPPPTKR
jgi:hypothetical protein